MGRFIVNIKESCLNWSDMGYSANVKDWDSEQIVYNNSIWVPNGYDRTRYTAAISLWEKIVEKFGPFLELELSNAPGITREFLNDGLNPRQYYAMIEWPGHTIKLSIHFGYPKLPILVHKYNLSNSYHVQDAAKDIRSILMKYDSIIVDLSKVDSFLRHYFE